MTTAVRSKDARKTKRAANVPTVVLAAIVLTVAAGFAWWLVRVRQSAHDSTLTGAGTIASSTPNAQPAFEATIANAATAPISLPEGVVYIPGGEFSMGSLDPTDMVCGGDEPMNDARPLHRVYVDGFFMDATEVTNEQFEQFAKSTGYVTVAERKPTREEFPTAPEENLVAGSVVFSPPPRPVPLDDLQQSIQPQ